MSHDFVQSLGLPFLAHRLKRASELMLEGSAEALRAEGFAAPARAGSTLLLLRENGPTGVTEIAYRLRLSHPLIIKLTAALAGAGLVENRADPLDNRRRLIALTDKGLAEAGRFDAFLRRLDRAFEEMFEEMGVDLFDAVERFERAAERRPIAERIGASGSRGRKRVRAFGYLVLAAAICGPACAQSAGPAGPIGATGRRAAARTPDAPAAARHDRRPGRRSVRAGRLDAGDHRHGERSRPLSLRRRYRRRRLSAGQPGARPDARPAAGRRGDGPSIPRAATRSASRSIASTA